MTKSIQRHICPASGQLDHRPGNIFHGRAVDSGNGTQLLRQSEFFVVNVNGNHVRANSICDHNRRQTYPSAAMYRDPLTGSCLTLVDHSAERRREPSPEAGCRSEVHALWQGYEVQIRLMDANIFGKRTPVGEAGLFLVVTDLLVTGMALGTGTAA